MPCVLSLSVSILTYTSLVTTPTFIAPLMLSCNYHSCFIYGYSCYCSVVCLCFYPCLHVTRYHINVPVSSYVFLHLPFLFLLQLFVLIPCCIALCFHSCLHVFRCFLQYQHLYHYLCFPVFIYLFIRLWLLEYINTVFYLSGHPLKFTLPSQLHIYLILASTIFSCSFIPWFILLLLLK